MLSALEYPNIIVEPDKRTLENYSRNIKLLTDPIKTDTRLDGLLNALIRL